MLASQLVLVWDYGSLELLQERELADLLKEVWIDLVDLGLAEHARIVLREMIPSGAATKFGVMAELSFSIPLGESQRSVLEILTAWWTYRSGFRISFEFSY